MSSKKVEFKQEIFDVVKDLSLINNSVIFSKSEEGDKILVKRKDIEQTIAYILEVPVDYFNFHTSDIAFYNYNEFYQYLKAFDNPELKVDENKIYMLENNSKIDYILSDKESIAKEGSINNVKFLNPDISIKLSSTDLDEIVKMNSLIRAKKAKLYGNLKDGISIKIFNNQHENSFEKTFAAEKIAEDFDGKVDFTIFSDMFTKIPQKRNYLIEIKKEGYIKISLIDENIKLSVYTGFVKN
jgi:hypothetical protein